MNLPHIASLKGFVLRWWGDNENVYS